MSDEWKIFYWPREAVGAGRAEFIRIVFEAAGVKYKHVSENVKEMFIDGTLEGYPCMAVPMIRSPKGDFQLSQGHVACKYLGKKFGLYPENEVDEAHGEQLSLTMHDYIAEGRNSFHAINLQASYFDQVDEVKPHIERFKTTRIPKYMKYLEKALAANGGGKGWMIGKKMTYVDLALLFILRSTASQFPDWWKEHVAEIPLLAALKERIEATPKISAYLKSDRLIPFMGNSML